ncbi:four-carbon acid sugar kinase family protein [Roseomonas gilardii]|uniref:four-carbon acid sugar kinase family protein n=1 Tax=Roseomonas gilardii TaxID=257708 RepID=UPI0011A19ACC|nr:four-carbon acid sugar kinase family protein [Roseomonas gilardii]
MMRWLILADDLTGAADCAIAFARRGLDATVGWHAGAAPQGVTPGWAAPTGGAVLAVDADSRRLPAAEAAARHAALFRRLHPLGERPAQGLIKKIDSTLRGQPVAELAATLQASREASGPRLAIVAPAFPGTGRTTSGGRIHLDGRPLERTPLWARDHSYAGAHLPTVLHEAGLRNTALPLAMLRDEAALAGALRQALAEGLEAVVCDAETPADLDRLAHASLPLAQDVFWVGSGGIAVALAAAQPMAPGGCEPVRTPIPASLAGGQGVLLVVGSVAEASRDAAARLAAEEAVTHFSVAPTLLRAGPAGRDWAPLSAKIAAALARGRDTLVQIAPDAGADLRQGAALAESLALLLAPAGACMAGLFATGGETACALLTRLGVHGIRLLEEVEPGVPLGITQGAVRIPVMTKAGAFGHDRSLLNSLARMHDLLGNRT